MPEDLKNREISLLIEPEPTQQLAYMSLYALSEKKGWRWMYSNTGVGSWQPRAWDTDETANAMLLEMMPEPTLRYRKVIGWFCRASSDVSYTATDTRKEAIRAAAYEWLTHKRQTGQ